MSLIQFTRADACREGQATGDEVGGLCHAALFWIPGFNW